MNPIKPLISNNTKKLLHRFRRESIDAVEMNKYLQAHPETNRNIGSLPYDWLKSFSVNERKNVTQQVQDVLTSFSAKTADVPGHGRRSGYSFVDAQHFSNEYTKLVESLKQILKRDDIKIKHAGSGAVKNCHRLDVGEYSYALSSFRAPCAAKEGFGEYYKSGHGRGYEPQNAFTAYKNASHGRWAKPFMVRVSDTEDEGGYILSKFVDKGAKAPFGFIQKACDAFINLDESGNLINNINIDIGGCLVNKNHIRDSFLRYWRGYFAQMMDNNAAIMKDFCALKVMKYLLEQKQNGADILAKDYVNTLPEDFDERARGYVVKMIRSMRNVRKQKNELIKSGRFDEIKNILQKDLDNLYLFDSNKNMIDDFLKILKDFPRLIVEEIGLSSNSSLDGWISMYHECGQFINFACLENRYTKNDIINFLEKHYENIRIDRNLVEKFRKSFAIEKELDVMENKYIML